MTKGSATRDANSDESCNEMKEQKGKGRKNETRKPWSRLQAMKESLEVTSPKTRS